MATRKERDRQKKAKIARAIELDSAGWGRASIAKELGISSSTLYAWFKEMNVPSKEEVNNNPIDLVEDDDPVSTELQEQTKKILDPDFLNSADKLEAHKEEAEVILRNIDDSKSLTEQEKIRSFLGNAYLQHLRDVVGKLPPIRNVKDLETYHKLLFESFGINAKENNKGTKYIEISILNNTKASKGEAVKIKNRKIIDVEVED